MLYPSIDKLLEKMESKYILVVAASRRARRLREGEQLLISSPNSHKYVGKALEEIFDEQIIIENSK
ncbi:DNA-directed RNA polymerase subunit omega [Tepidibacillus marianensis]|uniref:DNA-directed RNA polymerase subunit omega n=1 Tax=Tepidibacillus marianensis TaxID=3131995 RepID=UPI0030D3942D